MNNRKIGKILFVEDETPIQSELGEYLGEYCNELLLADDGFQGLSQFKTHNPDIVISDIRMPVMDGIEMCNEIGNIF